MDSLHFNTNQTEITMEKSAYEDMNEGFLQIAQRLTGLTRDEIYKIPAEELYEIVEDYQLSEDERRQSYVEPHYPNAPEGSIWDY